MYNEHLGDTRPSFHNLGGTHETNGSQTEAENGSQADNLSDLESKLKQALSPEHLQALREGSAIVPEVILERGYFTVTDSKELRELGFAGYQERVPALVIPVRRVDGRLSHHRSRPDEPRKDSAKPEKVVKYEQPKGTSLFLDVPSRVRRQVRGLKGQLWIVEGEKKADALVSQGKCAVSLPGVWGWKKNGLPLPDWDLIRLVGREVLVAFDSDAKRKVQVQRALWALASYLEGRGALVKIVELPDKADGSKQGVDDFLAAGGTVEELLGFSKDFNGLEVRDPKWPAMAEEAYHGLAGEIVRAITPNTESDPAGLLAMLLSVIGGVIGRGAHFKVEEDRHFCKINVVLVGETSKGRKGTAQNRINRLMRLADLGWYEDCITTGLSSGEGVIHRLRDPVYVEGKDGDLQLKDPGIEDKRLLIEEPEFASPLTVMRREGNTLSMVIRNLWDDRPLEILNKNSHEKATDTHASIIGHVTKKELLRHLNEEKLGGGIGNRFMFVLVKRSKVLPHGGDKDVFGDDQIRRLQETITFGKEEREIGLSGEAEEDYAHSAVELWEWVYADLSGGKPGLFGAVVSRAEAHVRRLATIYAVLDLSPVVRVAHLLAGLAVWQYAEQSAHLVFGDRTGDILADELLETLKDAGGDGMARSEIYDYFGRNQRRNRLGAVLRELKEQGLIRMEQEKTGEPGRPTERWYYRDA
jgi:hypothetical protein